MIQWDRIELIGAAVADAMLGGIAAIALGHERLGTIVWALAGAVVVSGVFYPLRFFR
jgi:outer membrane lipoprotein SlyB